MRVVAEEEDGAGAATSIGLREIGYITGRPKNHFAAGISDRSFRVGSTVV